MARLVQLRRHDPLDCHAERMELVAPLPTELTALVDPAARGAAPLLRSVTKDGDGPVAAVPFGVFLDLLAGRVPSGQELPAAGKGLPPPLGSPATPVPNAPIATLPGPAQALLMDAAGLRFDSAASPANPLTVSITAAAPPAPMLPLVPVAVPEDAPAHVAPPITSLAEPLALPAVPTDLPAAPSGVDTPIVDPALDAPMAPALRDLFATTPDQRPRLTRPVDARAATLASPTTGAEPRAAAAPAEVAAPVLRVVQRDGPHLTLRPVVAAPESASTASADWLPAAAAQPATHAAPAPHLAAAPAQASLNMNAPDWHEAFASRIQWLVDHRVGEAHLKLNPPELGAVDVKISLVDDQTFVQLTAATSSARDEFSQSLPRLRELLIASGLDFGGASVSSGRDGRHEAGGYLSQATAGLDRDVLELGLSHEHARSVPRRPAGRIDVFA